MKDEVYYIDHECDCGREIKVKMTVSDSGFESSQEGPSGWSWERGFGKLRLDMEIDDGKLGEREREGTE